MATRGSERLWIDPTDHISGGIGGDFAGFLRQKLPLVLGQLRQIGFAQLSMHSGQILPALEHADAGGGCATRVALGKLTIAGKEHAQLVGREPVAGVAGQRRLVINDRLRAVRASGSASSCATMRFAAGPSDMSTCEQAVMPPAAMRSCFGVNAKYRCWATMGDTGTSPPTFNTGVRWLAAIDAMSIASLGRLLLARKSRDSSSAVSPAASAIRVPHSTSLNILSLSDQLQRLHKSAFAERNMPR